MQRITLSDPELSKQVTRQVIDCAKSLIETYPDLDYSLQHYTKSFNSNRRVLKIEDSLHSVNVFLSENVNWPAYRILSQADKWTVNLCCAFMLLNLNCFRVGLDNIFSTREFEMMAILNTLLPLLASKDSIAQISHKNKIEGICTLALRLNGAFKSSDPFQNEYFKQQIEYYMLKRIEKYSVYFGNEKKIAQVIPLNIARQINSDWLIALILSLKYHGAFAEIKIQTGLPVARGLFDLKKDGNSYLTLLPSSIISIVNRNMLFSKLNHQESPAANLDLSPLGILQGG